MPRRSQVVKWVEMGGFSIWLLTILVLWMQAYEARTVAQTSFSTKWLSTIACLGLLWAVFTRRRRVKP
jgi:uncharacterized membrane protein